VGPKPLRQVRDEHPGGGRASSRRSTPAHREGRFHVLGKVLQNGLTLIGAVLFYYLGPLSTDDHPLWRWAISVVGLGTLIFLIIRQLRKQLAAGPDPGVRVHTLITYAVPGGRALRIDLLRHPIHRPHPIHRSANPHRLALHAVITLGTVGYGDVHAVGQMARVVSMVQVPFDLVVIGALIAVATSRFQVVPTPARVRRHKSEQNFQP